MIHISGFEPRFQLRSVFERFIKKKKMLKRYFMESLIIKSLLDHEKNNKLYYSDIFSDL